MNLKSKFVLACRKLSTASPALILPEYVAKAPKTQVTTLKNGIRVATERNLRFGNEAATIGVWIDAGSRHETDPSSGVAHFLEHLAFKGTQKRSQTMLEKEVEAMGSHLNAYTSREQTVFYAKCFAKDAEKNLEIMSDILSNSELNSSSIERERGVILREMQEINQMEEELLFDNLHETCFKGSALGRTILGPEENVLSLQREDLRKFIDQYYVGSNIVIAASGNLEHERVVEWTEKYFGGFAQGTASSLTLESQDAPNFIGSEIRVRNDVNNVAHVALAFEGKSWTDPDVLALMILQQMLGSWSRSQSAQSASTNFCGAVATKELAHSVQTFNTCYKDTGLFGVYAVSDAMTLNDLMHYTMESLVSVTQSAASESALHTAKLSLLTLLLSQSNDGSAATCEDIGRQMLTYGRRLDASEIWQRIEKVSADEVKKVAHDVIYDREIGISALGALHEMPDYTWLRRRTFWLRA